MTDEAKCVLQASMSCLPLATAFVDDFGVRQGITPNDVLRLRLIVEELFTNTALHGLGGEADAQVRLTLAAAPTQVELVYEDSAPPFDPLARLSQVRAELDSASEERRAGGIGLALATQMASRVSYTRDDGWNRLNLVMLRER
jgi:serine/threonine-protein kinase RsbW